jgi:hypothetical protein
MNRHQFRWDAFVFGLFFMAVLGQWAVWKMDWLAPDDLAYVAAAVLILLGVVGFVGTAISARADRRTAPFTPKASAETEPVEDQPTEDQPSEDQPSENEPTEPNEDEPTEIDSIDDEATRGGNPA